MRRHFASRPRNALLWTLAVFLGLQFGLSVVILVSCPDVRDPLYHDKANRLHARTVGVQPRPLTIVALGTSRTNEGFRAKQVEDQLSSELSRPVVVYNFGVSGAGPISRLIFLRRLLQEGVRPDLLLLEVFPPTLNGAVPVFELHQLPGSRLSWQELDVVSRYRGSTAELATSWHLSWLLPWYQHRFVLLTRLRFAADRRKAEPDLARTLDDWGQFGASTYKLTPVHRQRCEEAARAEYATMLNQNFRLGERPCRAYREILETCRRERIATALLWMPEGPTFRDWYSVEALAQVQGFLNDLSREFAVPVINAREWLNDEGDFRDSHHLLACGAERFSRRLGEAVGVLVRDGPSTAGWKLSKGEVAE
jgi:hypothetical protein